MTHMRSRRPLLRSCLEVASSTFLPSTSQHKGSFINPSFLQEIEYLRFGEIRARGLLEGLGKLTKQERSRGSSRRPMCPLKTSLIVFLLYIPYLSLRVTTARAPSFSPQTPPPPSLKPTLARSASTAHRRCQQLRSDSNKNMRNQDNLDRRPLDSAECWQSG